MCCEYEETQYIAHTPPIQFQFIAQFSTHLQFNSISTFNVQFNLQCSMQHSMYTAQFMHRSIQHSMCIFNSIHRSMYIQFMRMICIHRSLQSSSHFNLQFNSISIFNSLPIHAHSIQYADSNSSLNVQTILYRSIQHSIHRPIQFQFMHIQSSIQTILHRSIHAYSIQHSLLNSSLNSSLNSCAFKRNASSISISNSIPIHRLVFNIQT